MTNGSAHVSPATTYGRLGHGFKLYSDALRRYIGRRVREDWWEEIVAPCLDDEHATELDLERRQHAEEVEEAREGVLPKSGVEFLDVRHFAAIFGERFRAGERTLQLMAEIQEAHQRWARPPEGDYDATEVNQALAAMHEVLAYYQLPEAADIEALREGGELPERAYARLSDALKDQGEAMRRIFIDWAERESPAEWWAARAGEQRRTATERAIGDASQLPPEELVALLGPADFTAIVIEHCDLSGQERWLLRTVLRVRHGWEYPPGGAVPESYVAEATQWLRESLEIVADAVDALFEPSPDADTPEVEAEEATPVRQRTPAGVADYLTCGVVVAFAGAIAIAVILVGLALTGTRTWPVDRAQDVSGAAAGAVGGFVDELTGTAPPAATATPVATPAAIPTPFAPAAAATIAPTPTRTATPTPTPSPTPAPPPTATAEPSLSLERAIGNTDGDGVSIRDDCDDDARISAPGSGWPEGLNVEVIEIGSGRCAGWLLVQADGVASWVREEYVVSRRQ